MEQNKMPHSSQTHLHIAYREYDGIGTLMAKLCIELELHSVLSN